MSRLNLSDSSNPAQWAAQTAARRAATPITRVGQVQIPRLVNDDIAASVELPELTIYAPEPMYADRADMIGMTDDHYAGTPRPMTKQTYSISKEPAVVTYPTVQQVQKQNVGGAMPKYGYMQLRKQGGKLTEVWTPFN